MYHPNFSKINYSGNYQCRKSFKKYCSNKKRSRNAQKRLEVKQSEQKLIRIDSHILKRGFLMA